MVRTFGLILLAAAIAGAEPPSDTPTDVLRRSSELQHSGKLHEAEQLVRDLVNDKSLDDPSRVIALNELGLILMAAIRHDEAEKHLRRAIELAKQQPNLKPIYCMRARMNLCALYLETGRLPRAEEQLRYVASADLLTSLDKSQLTSLRAAVALLKDDQRLAIQIYQEHLSELRSATATREVSVDIATTLNNLGTAATRSGNYSEAARYFTEALALWRAISPAEQAGLLRTLVNLGACREMQKAYEPASALLAEAIEIARPLLGENNLLTAGIYAEYAVVLGKTGRKKEAKEFTSMAKRAAQQASAGTASGLVVDISELSSFRAGKTPGTPAR